MALYRPGCMRQSVVYTVDEILAYRDTWTMPFDDLNVDELLKPPAAASMLGSPLTPSEKAFRTTAVGELAKEDQLVRLVQGTLNKITAENFDVLAPTLLQPALFEAGVARKVVDRIFKKSLDEPKYAGLYATLCLRLAKYEHSVLEGSKLVCTSIIEKAQEVYESQMTATVTGNGEDEDRMRKRKLANINFVALLFRHQLLSPKIVIRIARTIVDAKQQLPETDVEVVVTLLRKVGDVVEKTTVSDPSLTQPIWARLAELKDRPTEQGGYSQRVRFAIIDLMELRSKGWIGEDNGLAASTPLSPGAQGNTDFVTASLAHSATCLEGRPPLPPEMSPETKVRVMNALRRFSTDPTDVMKLLSTCLKDCNPTINRVACLAHAIDKVCQSTVEEERLTLCTALLHPSLESAEARAAIAWATANAIVSDILEDCPKFFERLANVMVSIAGSKSESLALVMDCAAMAASHLDAVQAQYNADWDETYLAFWSSWLRALKNSGRPEMTLESLLGSMKTLTNKGIAGRTLTDIISLIPENGLCTYEDLSRWHASNKTVPEMRYLIEASSLLV